MNRQHRLIQQHRAFTLIELMAVVLIICIMVGIVISVGSYVTRSAEVGRAKAQMMAMETALEAYKADVGYYPVSKSIRFSGSGFGELTNSWLLYRALTNKPYYTPRQTDIGTLAGMTFYKDPWGAPWNYYNNPGMGALNVQNINNGSGTAMSTSYATGGQMNPASYDLFSFGPDGSTYIPGSEKNSLCGSCWRGNDGFTVSGSSSDDIANWKQ